MIPLKCAVLQECCYDSEGTLSIEESRYLAGHPMFEVLHYAYDQQPRNWCCEESDLCYLYEELRPTSRCRSIYVMDMGNKIDFIHFPPNDKKVVMHFPSLCALARGG